ncbi:transposase [Paenibacillus sp. CECT 9249]|uniref:transposase n=1 Tax=Paenibacillus sp. CECT 9249 TaxID=2845385 RepID=UPI0033A50154
MAAVASSLQRCAGGILRWFQSRMTNRLLEGMNSLVQAAKRKARGYRTTRNFIAMIAKSFRRFGNSPLCCPSP